MKYIRQFVIILFISFIGEALKYVLPLPIPASIYGLVLMFVLLGNESAEGGSGSGCGKISDRDHADDVYSGRCRSAERMGYIKTSVDSDNCDLVCIHNCSYGCFRKSNTDDD